MSDSPATRPMLEVEGLSVRLPSRAGLLGPSGPAVHAVEEVSLAVPRGGSLGLIGESGCGKSTLCRALLRLVAPSAGRVHIDGLDLATLDDGALRRFRRRAQMVFQDSQEALDPRYTARDAIAEPLRVHRVLERNEVGGEVERLLARVGLAPELGDRYPHELSGGERQRVALARALACRPSLLVADEPMSALDAEHRAAMAELLEEARRSEGLTLLLVSHDLRAVRRLCDRVAVMYLGRIVEEGPVAEVLLRPRHPYTAALIAAAPPWPPLDGNSPYDKSPRLRLAGEPPSPISPPTGCAFHPRCPKYRALERPAKCASERPVGAMACHFGEAEGD